MYFQVELKYTLSLNQMDYVSSTALHLYPHQVNTCEGTHPSRPCSSREPGYTHCIAVLTRVRQTDQQTLAKRKCILSSQ